MTRPKSDSEIETAAQNLETARHRYLGQQRERPILFSTLMVRRILGGIKSQTRRVISPLPKHLQRHEWRGRLVYEGEHRLWCWKGHTFENLWDRYLSESDRARLATFCPYGAPGDQLWLRETWGIGTRPCPATGWRDGIEYRADTGSEPLPLHPLPDCGDVVPIRRRGWRPSIHMPRWASRITLEITDVRVERLQEISEDDARAEGVDEIVSKVPTARDAFRMLWDDINGKRVPWASNPFVWALTFRRIT